MFLLELSVPNKPQALRSPLSDRRNSCDEREVKFRYNSAVWRTFHILGRKQIFVVSSVSSAVIATSFVLTSMSHNQTGILRDLVWPHQFAPIIIFGAAFLSLLPHSSRLLQFGSARCDIKPSPVVRDAGRLDCRCGFPFFNAFAMASSRCVLGGLFAVVFGGLDFAHESGEF